MIRAWLFVPFAMLAVPAVASGTHHVEVRIGGVAVTEGAGAVLAHDADDDDEDGVADAVQSSDVPGAGLAELSVLTGGRAEIRVEGPLRIVRDGRPVSGTVTLAGSRRPHVLHLQGTAVSERPEDAALVVDSEGRSTRVGITVVGLAFLDASNARIDPTGEAVGVSHAITNDATLARQTPWSAAAMGRDDVRLEIRDPRARGDEVRAAVDIGPPGGSPRWTRTVILRRPRPDAAFRSDWLRLVADEMDQQAPGVGERLLRVALRDRVAIRYPAEPAGASQGVRVGRPGSEDGPKAARRGRLRVRVLRARPGGVPAVGGDDATALAIARRQIAIANEVWLQCHVGFGDPDTADVAVVDPPAPALVAIGDVDGLPARGRGTIRLRVGGRAIRPVTTRPGAPPVQTALDLASAVRELGFAARVTENPPTELGAGRSADLVVRDARGAPVAVSADGDHPVTTDVRQTVRIGAVDLSDGLREFDNMTATAGTLEERTMIKVLGDDDPDTVDIFVVNHFTGGTRQGEAFIEADGGAIVNTVILDRNGIRQEREAWTQSHELGHVLLNQPFHPDNVGADRPWLLMDADSSLGLVTGPKRLTRDECYRARIESGARAVPALLDRAP